MSQQQSFFEVPRTTQDTSEGPVDLPILYYDTSYVLAFFMVEQEKVAAQLDDPDLRLALNYKDKTLVGLANYQYRNSTVGDYGETGLAIPVVPRTTRAGNRWLQTLVDPENTGRDLGFLVKHLPVTTPAANAAGREIWGLPKFVTPIKVDFRGRMVDVNVDDPDGLDSIMTLTGRAGIGIPTPQIPIMLYSRLNGQMLRTTVNAQGSATSRLGGNVILRVGGSQHPMAQTMRELGMDGLSPFTVQMTHAFRSRLNAGVPIDVKR